MRTTLRRNSNWQAAAHLSVTLRKKCMMCDKLSWKDFPAVVEELCLCSKIPERVEGSIN